MPGIKLCQRQAQREASGRRAALQTLEKGAGASSVPGTQEDKLHFRVH